MTALRVAILSLLALLMSPLKAAGFSDWAAVVVAGDSYAHSGKRSAVFDNARIAIAGELVGMGFRPENIRQFSDRPKKYREGHPARSTLRNIARGLAAAAEKAPGGCLVYLTSHGDEEGAGIGDDLMTPKSLAGVVDSACQARPAVVVVSACFSGVFVPHLKKPDHIVLTAAAADRSSFGCGEDEKYNYFDTCTVALLPKAGDFESFGRQAIACVREREKKEGMNPPSNPQLFVGDKARALIPRWK